MKQSGISRVIIDRFDSGDDILQRLDELVRKEQVSSGSFTAVGTVERATVGYFTGNGSYASISLQGPLEILSLVGNVSLKEGAPFVHAHITLSDKEGRAYGGHLMAGCRVDATFELMLHAYDGVKVERKFDEKTKLFLLDL